MWTSLNQSVKPNILHTKCAFLVEYSAFLPYYAKCYPLDVWGLVMNETFGARLARLRKARGFTGMEDLAKVVGVKRGAISVWEHDVRLPRPKNLRELGGPQALDCPVEYLRTGAGPGPTWLTPENSMSNQRRSEGAETIAEVMSSARERIAQIAGVRTDAVKLELKLEY
jgi:transcriptional regulator with XRE-family HTH domain